MARRVRFPGGRVVTFRRKAKRKAHGRQRRRIVSKRGGVNSAKPRKDRGRAPWKRAQLRAARTGRLRVPRRCR